MAMAPTRGIITTPTITATTITLTTISQNWASRVMEAPARGLARAATAR